MSAEDTPQSALLRWYEQTRRILPWREQPTPYRVWMSEIMLQQTRVDTVLPYFERFTARWPTVAALASAPEQEVLEAWAGLGYYSRARNLHKAARQVAALGGFPLSVEGLRALPGVGDYTAGAIASIAFGADAVAVDGNIERVLSRLFLLTGDPRSTEGRRAVWAAARSALPPGRAGDWNQALMDLGARICTPKKPRCGACPLAPGCLAHKRGEAEALPRKKKKRPPEPVRGAWGALVRGGRLLLVRRPRGGLLGGMWALPGSLELGDAPPRQGLLAAFERTLGLRLSGGQELGSVVHVFTHRRLTLSVWEVEAEGEPGEAAPEHRWVPLEELAALGLPKLTRKAVDAAGLGVGGPPRQAALFAAQPPGYSSGSSGSEEGGA